MLIVTAALALVAVVVRSSLLMARAVLAASACLGARTGYGHAVYSLAIFEPTLTVLLFSALALIAYGSSGSAKPTPEGGLAPPAPAKAEGPGLSRRGFGSRPYPVTPP
jgi:hypothetical protein